MTGTIKKLVSDKGYGFILGSNGKEYFFHSTAVKTCPYTDLAEGEVVTFETVDGPKGPRAEQVTPQ